MQAEKRTNELLLKTAKGQIDGILKMIEEDQYCIDISNQIMASQAILKKVNQDILEAHLKGCVKDAKHEDMDEKIDEVVSILKKMGK